MVQSIYNNYSEPMSISHAWSLIEVGAFWDEHDLTDFDTDLPDVEFDLSAMMLIESDHPQEFTTS